ncbi:MAG: flavodoxin [Vallitalea sp.]|jgi:flavodoxin short chain|nr:flavodoxin [Vallitalea sp.]
MKKINIIYWSGTGNTEAMAHAIAEGAKGEDNEVKVISVDEAQLSDVEEADAVALGCPSMGDEVLEESEMEPFVESLQSINLNKPVGLFGSYGWGNGEWMIDWEERMEGYGASLINKGLIVNNDPEDDDIENCKKLGEMLASS